MYGGFDLGGKCGFAVLGPEGERLYSTTWTFGKRSGQTFLKYQQMVYHVISHYAIATVGYEKVRRHKGTLAAQAYGAYEAILWLVCTDLGAAVQEISVAHIKKTATGNGHADKEDVEASAFKRWSYLPSDDNESDALWIAECVRLTSASV